MVSVLAWRLVSSSCRLMFSKLVLRMLFLFRRIRAQTNAPKMMPVRAAIRVMRLRVIVSII